MFLSTPDSEAAIKIAALASSWHRRSEEGWS